MKKQGRRKSIKTEPSIVLKGTENTGPSNSASQSIVQAKPSIEQTGPDLSGEWKTCGGIICLKRNPDTDSYEGNWGIHVMKLRIEGVSIPKPHLGSMELMFDGVLRNLATIEWGNGQVWTR